MRYTCIRCGKEFEAKRRTAVCKDCHTGICAVCGKEFKLQSPWTQKTCSKECRGEYVKDSGISKQRTNKAKQTLKSKYGVSNTEKEIMEEHGYVRVFDSGVIRCAWSI